MLVCDLGLLHGLLGVCVYVSHPAAQQTIICLLVLPGGGGGGQGIKIPFDPLTFEDIAASLPVDSEQSGLVTCLSSFF